MDENENKELDDLVTEDDAFEDAFNSFSDGDTADDEPVIEDDDGANDDDQVVQDEPETGDQDEPETGDQSEQNVTDDDPWVNATEAQLAALKQLREENAALNHKFVSHDGRVVSLRKQVSDLEQQLNAARTITPTQQESALPSSEELDAFRNDYPDVADAMERYYNQRLSEDRKTFEAKLAQLDNRLSQTIQPFQEAEKQRSVEAQVNALQERHPDWRDLAYSDEFVGWVNRQPEAVRQLYQSDYGDDISYLLDNFKLHTNRVVQEEPEPTGSTTRDKLQTSITPRGRRGAPRTGVPDDFDDAFDYYAK